MFQNQNRFHALSIELIALIILIPVAIFLSAKIWQRPAAPTQQIITPTVATSSTPAAIPSSTPTGEAKYAASTPAGQTITLIFEGPNNTFSYQISTEKKLTAIEAMRIAQKQGLVLKTKDYGAPLGILIEGINNIDNDAKNQKYWTLYVNDVRSAVGASTATVSPGDTITWKFENTTL